VFAWIWNWTARHPVAADAMVAVPFLAFCLFLYIPYTSNPGGLLSGTAYLAYTIPLCLPLLIRRRVPLIAFAVISLVALTQLPTGTLLPADVAVLISMYNVVVRRSWPWAIAAGLVAQVGVVCVSLMSDPVLGAVLVNLMILVSAVWIAALYTASRRAQLEGFRERARQLERERDAQAQIGAASERARIARELHDVVAHNVSVMVVQADGASFTIDTEPAAAKQALTTISATGREALVEMRRLLGVFREEGESDYMPQPGVAQLHELVEQTRAAGLPVDLRIDGVSAELPSGVELIIYRVIQESLTNSLKHAGPRATARAHLHYGDDVIEMTVTDDGRGSAASSDGFGNGLLGMRERVRIYGGSVRVGPRTGGGFEVLVRLPTRIAVPASGE